jgi:hypothetical protein
MITDEIAIASDELQQFWSPWSCAENIGLAMIRVRLLARYVFGLFGR